MGVIALIKDIDLNSEEALATGYAVLCSAFDNDPVMQLFDKDARNRLAGFIINTLVDHPGFGDRPLNLYSAGIVAQRAVEDSIYATFGKNLSDRVGYLVQRHLFPNAYKEGKD